MRVKILFIVISAFLLSACANWNPYHSSNAYPEAYKAPPEGKAKRTFVRRRDHYEIPAVIANKEIN